MITCNIYANKCFIAHVGFTILAHASSPRGPSDCSEYSHVASGDQAPKRPPWTSGESIYPAPLTGTLQRYAARCPPLYQELLSISMVSAHTDWRPPPGAVPPTIKKHSLILIYKGETHLPLQTSPIEISMAYRYPGERLPVAGREAAKPFSLAWNAIRNAYKEVC